MKKTVTIKENRDFRRIYSRGRSAVTPFLVLYCRPNGRDSADRYGTFAYTSNVLICCGVLRPTTRRRGDVFVPLPAVDLFWPAIGASKGYYTEIFAGCQQ